MTMDESQIRDIIENNPLINPDHFAERAEAMEKTRVVLRRRRRRKGYDLAPPFSRILWPKEKRDQDQGGLPKVRYER